MRKLDFGKLLLQLLTRFAETKKKHGINGKTHQEVCR